MKSNLVDSGGRDTVNILICVDSGFSKELDCNLGGWAPQGLIVEGLMINAMCSLGNVLTSIRECQALMSLRSLSKPLQEVIISGGSGQQLISKDIQINSSSNNNTNNSNNNNMNNNNLNNSSNLNKNKSSDQISTSTNDYHKCPEGLPSALWSSLSEQYNSSQLRAIHAVCLPTNSTSTSNSNSNSTGSASSNSTGSSGPNSSSLSSSPTVTLLQGPPGTGKTRTILAIVAALLAGAGSMQKKAGSKVRKMELCLYNFIGIIYCRLQFYPFFLELCPLQSFLFNSFLFFYTKYCLFSSLLLYHLVLFHFLSFHFFSTHSHR